jgi:hypothetical protein
MTWSKSIKAWFYFSVYVAVCFFTDNSLQKKSDQLESFLAWFYFADYVAVFLCINNVLQKKTYLVNRCVSMILLYWLCSSVFVYI